MMFIEFMNASCHKFTYPQTIITGAPVYFTHDKKIYPLPNDTQGSHWLLEILDLLKKYHISWNLHKTQSLKLFCDPLRLPISLSTSKLWFNQKSTLYLVLFTKFTPQLHLLQPYICDKCLKWSFAMGMVGHHLPLSPGHVPLFCFCIVTGNKGHVGLCPWIIGSWLCFI